jgi:hypothetical protein
MFRVCVLTHREGSRAMPPKRKPGGPAEPLPAQHDDPDLPRLITLQEAAARLSLSYWAMRDLVLRGYLPRVRLPGRPGKDLHRILIDARDVERFIAEHRETRVHIPTPRGARKAS